MTDPMASGKTAQTLRRIALALGCTVEDLMSDKEPFGSLEEAKELFALWDAIVSDAGRQIVLKTAREVVRSQKAVVAPA